MLYLQYRRQSVLHACFLSSLLEQKMDIYDLFLVTVAVVGSGILVSLVVWDIVSEISK